VYTELTERDLIRVRLRFLDILKSFFQGKPDAETLSRWRGIFAALEGETVSHALDGAIRKLGALLTERSLSQIQDEHYRLFVDPYSADLLPLNASYYRDGKSFGPSLAVLREIMKQGRIVKEAGISEPEDALPLMLDTFIALIAEEIRGEQDTSVLQSKLLRQFLIPSTTQIQARIVAQDGVTFYQQCFKFLQAYLELENRLLKEQNLEFANNRQDTLTTMEDDFL
jgi:TorA maturation chaperone TorD